MAYGDFEDLTRRTALDKILRDKAFNIAKNPKFDGYQRKLASLVYKFFDKKTSGSGIKNQIVSNKELVKELHKPNINEKIQKAKSMQLISLQYLITDMQLISKFNKRFTFLLCVIDIYSKYAWVIPLKDKKGITITNAFQKFFGKSNRKPNKIWAVNFIID